MGCLPSEMVLAVDKSPFDSKSSPLKQQVSKDLQQCKVTGHDDVIKFDFVGGHSYLSVGYC